MNDPILPPDAPSDELMALTDALDGSATAEQLALVDASPELGQQLAELVAARAEMADVEVPAVAREAGIAAALGAFDQLHAPVAASAASSNVVAFGRRRTWYRGVMAAAAAVIVVVGGIGVLANLGGGSDDDDSASIALDSDQKASATTSGAEPMAAAATAPAAADEAATAETESPATRMETSEGGAAETTAAASTADSTVETIDGIPGPAEIDLSDEQALRGWASTRDAIEGGPECGDADDEQLGGVRYQGQAVVVARDLDTGDLLVYAADGCALVITVPA